MKTHNGAISQDILLDLIKESFNKNDDRLKSRSHQSWADALQSPYDMHGRCTDAYHQWITSKLGEFVFFVGELQHWSPDSITTITERWHAHITCCFHNVGNAICNKSVFCTLHRCARADDSRSWMTLCTGRCDHLCPSERGKSHFQLSTLLCILLSLLVVHSFVGFLADTSLCSLVQLQQIESVF